MRSRRSDLLRLRPSRSIQVNSEARRFVAAVPSFVAMASIRTRSARCACSLAAVSAPGSTRASTIFVSPEALALKIKFCDFCCACEAAGTIAARTAATKRTAEFRMGSAFFSSCSNSANWMIAAPFAAGAAPSAAIRRPGARGGTEVYCAIQCVELAAEILTHRARVHPAQSVRRSFRGVGRGCGTTSTEF